MFNIVREELCEGEIVERKVLETGLERITAVCKLSPIFKQEIAPWEKRYLMIETGFESSRGYYFWGVPVDHDRCLRVKMEEVCS